MGTRQSSRDRLLDAVDDVVFAAGDPHAPVDRILGRAGVSPATLYRAYAGRDALVAAALDRRHHEWLEVWDAAVARAETDRDRLLALFDALDDFRSRATGARWCAFLGTAAAVVDPPAVLAAAVRQESESLRQRLQTWAQPLAGERAPELAEGLALIFSGELAMRLRPAEAPPATQAPPATGVARHVAGLLIDHLARSTSGAPAGS